MLKRLFQIAVFSSLLTACPHVLLADPPSSSQVLGKELISEATPACTSTLVDTTDPAVAKLLAGSVRFPVGQPVVTSSVNADGSITKTSSLAYIAVRGVGPDLEFDPLFRQYLQLSSFDEITSKEFLKKDSFLTEYLGGIEYFGGTLTCTTSCNGSGGTEGCTTAGCSPSASPPSCSNCSCSDCMGPNCVCTKSESIILK